MADAFFLFALENLANFATDEVKLLRSTKEEVNKLRDTLSLINAYLRDAERRQYEDEAVQEWLTKLKYLAYEVDDVLDDWKVKSYQLNTNNRVWNLFGQCICLQQLVMHHNIGKRMKNVNKKLDQIVIEKNRFGFQQNTTGFDVGSFRMTSSCVDSSEVVGREDEKNKIINMLLTESSTVPSVIPVISIVGMGGYGKTTLAKLVFNEDEVKSHFEELIWVCAANEFDVAKIVKMIIEAIKKEHPTAIGLEALFKVLQDKLKGKRFLLVLDDVWNENFGKWEELVNILKKCGANGCKIVVTTRHEKVAQVIHSSYTHKLGSLCFEDCWSIFRKIAFQDINECEFSNLINVGRKIVTKCKGIPLAIKTVAGALRSVRTRSHWENALNAEIWNQPAEGILPALMLSYYHLSSTLKRCFQYCSMFQKDSIIIKDDLVCMWVSQGYIAHDENKEMEDIGNQYFEELLGRSLLQEPQRDYLGSITKCKMHDMVHDLAQFVTNSESSFIDGSKENSMFNNRKLRHCTWNGERFEENNSTAFKNLRTLVATYKYYVIGDNSRDSNRPLEQLECIRVLSLRGIMNLKLLESIGKLVHLRYLNLSWIIIEALPESIGKLWNLRYLILRYTGLKKLPESIGKLSQLRYLNLEMAHIEKLPESITNLHHLRLLHLNHCQHLRKLPDGIGKLTSLDQLDRFIVTEGECNLSELRDLNHLRGSLSIENLEAGSIDEAVNAKLVDKSSLQKLQLTWSRRAEPSTTEGVLKALQPHPSLQELRVSHYQGSNFPSWVGAPTFSDLVKVQLWGGPNCSELPALGNLPQLRSLEIGYMPKVRKVGSEFFGSKNGFPKLEFLSISNLKEWEEWDSSLLPSTGGGVGQMPSLCKFRIYNCARLKALPPIFSEELRQVVIWGLGNLSGLESIPPTVQKIYMSSCPAELISELPSLPKLEHLTINDMTLELSCDLLRFTGLKTLRIERCSELKSLPEEFLNSLKGLLELHIFHCPELNRSRETGIVAHMPCLRRLQICDCENLKMLPRIVSEDLKEVDIHECPNLSEVGFIPPSTENLCLPAKLLSTLPSLPVLIHLEIEGDEEVMELSNSLIRFTELQKLKIKYCPNLSSLPEEMGSLRKLRELEIYYCHNLKESCKMGGEQWSKIAHIPRIKINDEIIQDHA